MTEDARSAAGGSGAGQPRILLGHGSGGRLYRDLVRDVFLAHFDNPVLARLDDAAALVSPGRIALTTDAHVVQPLVFAGGDIVTGAATVILAMGAGRRAAKSIHDYLTDGQW